MTTGESLVCRPGGRRAELLRQRDGKGGHNGIDYVEVLPGPSLCVHFFGDVPLVRDPKHPHGLTPDNFVVRGGRRITGLRVLRLEIESSGDPERDDCLRLRLDREGDFSTYRVCIVGVDGFDPRYMCADVTFRLDCAADLDCDTDDGCDDDDDAAEPEISYLAKDYATFRRLILDRLAVTMPDWRERHEADVGITLVELLAYAGDHLSYYQDAVGTEAYLQTARQRISVRRHVRLVDYYLHEGLNARAWVSVWTDSDTPAVPRSELSFVTAVPGLPDVPGNHRLLRSEDLRKAAPGSYLVFEPVGDPDEEVTFRAAHSELRFYTWGEEECCLPSGTSSATLLDPDRALCLEVGDVLVLEEVKGTRTGHPADADPTRRHVIRLRSVTPATDELLGIDVVEITWSPADALPFALCLSVRLPAPDCTLVTDVSVARGNVLLVDHGEGVTEPLDPVDGSTVVDACGCDGAVLESTPLPFRFTPVLGAGPLTFADPVDLRAPAAAAAVRDPRQGLPALALTSTTGPRSRWTPRPDLLTSGPDDRHVVVEVDDDGRAHLRFGDGELGKLPPVGATFAAAYRVGGGPLGNVGPDAITTMVLRTQTWSGADVRPRNPLPATGGTAPEPVAEAKLMAPDAFRERLRRAITAEDYATIAGGLPGVQSAAAELAWTGSWYEATVAVDELGADEAGPELLQRVGAGLDDVRRLGHDLAVEPARSVPVDLRVEVCVDPHHSRGVVKAAVLDVLGNRRLANGRLGLFHPDRLTFGTSVRTSQVVALVQAIPGVASVEVTRLRRLDRSDAGELDAGVLTVHNLEIARLSGDPSLPENGRLVLVMGGGR
ncbi:putative baseplate assembly protein [Pseudarthrobacter sp. YS3]|uniref:putative baseplate assembly protein n=1 Tax=Pseudarthrobacter sp. YS3 TaxID=3453718 RepID=UPI003EEE962F